MAPGLAIRRLTLDLHAPSGAAAHRAEQALRAGLPAALAEALALPAGEEVLLFRRLDIDLTLPAGLAAQEMPARLAEAIAAGLRRGAADGRTAVRFASPAAHAAAFLVALAEGTAWGRWWFRGFDGVRALPVPAAIRTVLLRDAAQALVILAALSPAQRTRVVAALGEAEAAHVVAAVLAHAPDAIPQAIWRLVLDAQDGATDAGAALCVAAAAGATPAALLAVRRLQRLLVWTEAAPQAAARWLATGAMPVGLDRAVLRLLAATPGEVREALAARPAHEAPLPESLFSPLGGAALLCPALLGWPLAGAAQGWDAGDIALLHLLLLASAAGTAGLLDDTAFRALFGVAPGMTAAEMRDRVRRIGPTRWSALAVALDLPGASAEGAGLPRAAVPPRIARSVLARGATALLADLGRRLPGFAAASPAFLRANLLGRGAAFRFLPEAVEVRLERPPLDVLLSITGLAGARATLPDGRLLVLDRAP